MNKFISSNLFFFTFLCLSIFTVYGKSINFGFTNLDDDELIVNNINYISNMQNIPHFFTESCYHSSQYYYYRPLLTLSFSIESILFKNNFIIYHLDNMILFIFSIYFIYMTFLKLNFNKIISKYLSLLIAMHPALSSCIVWLPARNDTLFVIFAFLSLLQLINYLKYDKMSSLILYCFFFALSLFTKETAIILIPLYLLLIYTFDFKLTKKQLILNVILFLPIIIIYLMLRKHSVPTLELTGYISNYKVYIKDSVVGLMTYIKEILFPYNVPVMLYKIKINFQTIFINLILFIPIIFIYFKRFIRRKILYFGSIWFVISLLPTFFQSDYAFLMHRIIFSVFGLLVIIIAIIDKIILNFSVAKKYFFILFITLYFLFSYISFNQADKYKNADIFWSNAYINASNYHLVCSGLAKQHFYSGNYKKAKELLYRAKQLNNIYDYDLDIVTVLIAEGNLDEALDRLFRLLKLKEKFMTLRYLSEIYYVKGDMEKSTIYAQKAFNLDQKDKLLLKHLKRLPDFNSN